MALLVYVPDLMDRSKVLAAVPTATVVSAPGQIEAGPGDTVVLDLSRPASLEAVVGLRRAGARVIGFASHVDHERIDAAREAGCEVLARSAFFSRLPVLLG